MPLVGFLSWTQMFQFSRYDIANFSVISFFNGLNYKQLYNRKNV